MASATAFFLGTTDGDVADAAVDQRDLNYMPNASANSYLTKDRNNICLSVFSLVNVLLPQRGVFQIVEDRFLAGSAFLLVLHPHNCVLHSKIQDKQ